MDRERSRSRISRFPSANNNGIELRRPNDREREERERGGRDREQEHDLERRRPARDVGNGKPHPGDPDWIVRDSKIEATTDPDAVALV